MFQWLRFRLRHSAIGNGEASEVTISRDFVLWHFRDFLSWYVWQFMQCWYPVLQLRAIYTRLCGQWQHIPLSCVSAYLRQVPLANLFLMHIKAALYIRKEAVYGNISRNVEEFKRYQDKGGNEFDQTPAYLFWCCRCGRDSFLYLYQKDIIGTQASALIMVAVMLPFFFLAMYEKDGFPAEKILYFMIRQKFLTPGIRPYKSENLYNRLKEQEKMKKEVRYLEAKVKGKITGQSEENCQA